MISCASVGHYCMFQPSERLQKSHVIHVYPEIEKSAMLHPKLVLLHRFPLNKIWAGNRKHVESLFIRTISTYWRILNSISTCTWFQSSNHPFPYAVSVRLFDRPSWHGAHTHLWSVIGCMLSFKNLQCLFLQYRLLFVLSFFTSFSKKNPTGGNPNLARDAVHPWTVTGFPTERILKKTSQKKKTHTHKKAG